MVDTYCKHVAAGAAADEAPSDSAHRKDPAQVGVTECTIESLYVARSCDHQRWEPHGTFHAQATHGTEGGPATSIIQRCVLSIPRVDGPAHAAPRSQLDVHADADAPTSSPLPVLGAATQAIDYCAGPRGCHLGDAQARATAAGIAPAGRAAPGLNQVCGIRHGEGCSVDVEERSHERTQRRPGPQPYVGTSI